VNLYLTHGRDLVRREGTSNQVERLDAGVLPDDEFDHIIREYLFSPLGPWPRFKKLKAEPIKELAMLRGKSDGQDRVTFETILASDLKDHEWEQLKELKGLFPRAQDVEAYWVVATCGEFEQKFTKARITLNYYGRIFQKEVQLK